MDLKEARALGLTERVQGRYGSMEYLKTDVYIAQSWGVYREFSEGEVALFKKLVRIGDVVVTAGVNCGSHLVPLAKIVGPQGIVFAVEPQQILFELARENVSANELGGRVILDNVALGAQPGTMYLPPFDYREHNNYGGTSIMERQIADGPQVQVTTIDALVGEEPIDFIHLDVEGAELDALLGASETIERCRPVLYLEADRDDKREALFDHLIRLHYDILPHQPPLFNPKNFAGKRQNLFGNVVSMNVLAIPQ